TTTHAYATAGGSPFDVLAVYSGDADFSSSSAGDTHTVDPAATTTALTTASPAVTGQTVTLTATVTAVAPGAPTPTGTVTFSFGDGSPSITTALTAGVATTTHAYASASGSPYTVTAVYNGNTDFAGSTATGTQTVDPAATTIGVSTSPAPSTVGQPITVTAVVVPVAAGAGTPSGTVSFSFGDGTPSVTVPVNAGVAVAAHTYLSTSGSPYAITATYNDDAGYTGSSRSITQTVGRTPTVTAVTAAPAPSAVGQPMTATVTVGALPPGSGAPTGTVTVDFGDGTTPVVAPLAGATAVLTHTYAHAIGGPYVITASYGGDGDFGSSQTTVIQTVIRASTTLSLAGAPDPSVVGEPVTFTATVAPSAGTGAATGTVRFDFGDNTPPADAPLVSGVATVQHVYASASGSPYAVTAVYGGDGDFTGSAGHTTQTVGRASTVTSVSTSPNPSLPGEQVTVTATVAPVPLDAGSPTGSVTFDFGDGTSGVTAPVTGGVATASHTYTTTTGSPRAVIAVYGGDGDFTGSAGHTTQTVGRASSVTTVSTSPDPSVTGQQVTVTAVIGPVAPAAGAPTGTVTFDFGDGTAAVSVPVTDGTAATTHTYVSASGGPHTVTAAYDGDFDFAPSTGTTSHTVGRAGTTTSLTSTPEPSAVGQEV
ncbi:beta strand repeat-containing protein, partial [Streptomyces anandii]|uniref:beta strand repeat-containing protein n=1 Tax=Streptomyces anandii TaxID=285454 RepID=UPI0037B98B33